MYRVFEALDELSAIVEEARGVPMTAGCMVPRGDVLVFLSGEREIRDTSEALRAVVDAQGLGEVADVDPVLAVEPGHRRTPI